MPRLPDYEHAGNANENDSKTVRKRKKTLRSRRQPDGGHENGKTPSLRKQRKRNENGKHENEKKNKKNEHENERKNKKNNETENEKKKTSP